MKLSDKLDYFNSAVLREGRRFMTSGKAAPATGSGDTRTASEGGESEAPANQIDTRDRNRTALGTERLRAAGTQRLEAPPWDEQPAPAKAKKARTAVLAGSIENRLEAIARKENAPLVDALRQEVESYMRKGGSREVAEAILAQLEDAGNIRQDKTKQTCGAVSMQLMLAKANPAAYFRMAADLFEDGKAHLGGAGDLTVGKDNLKAINKEGKKKSDNWRLNAMIQTAFMDDMNGKAKYIYGADVSKTKIKKKERKRATRQAKDDARDNVESRKFRHLLEVFNEKSTAAKNRLRERFGGGKKWAEAQMRGSMGDEIRRATKSRKRNEMRDLEREHSQRGLTPAQLKTQGIILQSSWFDPGRLKRAAGSDNLAALSPAKQRALFEELGRAVGEAGAAGYGGIAVPLAFKKGRNTTYHVAVFEGFTADGNLVFKDGSGSYELTKEEALRVLSTSNAQYGEIAGYATSWGRTSARTARTGVTVSPYAYPTTATTRTGSVA